MSAMNIVEVTHRGKKWRPKGRTMLKFDLNICMPIRSNI